MSLPGLDSLTGGGGLSGGTAGPSGVGASPQTSTTGAKTINIGGNPNVTSGALKWPLLIGGALLAVWVWRKYK